MAGIDSETLIDAVEARPAIWDMRSSDYGDRLKRRQAWEEIIVLLFAPESTITPEEKKSMGDAVQKRWKNLRDRYAREVSKVKRVKSGSEAKKRPSYIFAQRLAFLRDVVEQNSTTSSLDISNLGNSEQPESERADVNADNAELTMESSNDQRKPEQSSSSQEKRFSKKRRLDPVELKIISALEANAAEQKIVEKKDDDDRYFLLSLLPIIKTIPEHYKLSSRMEIMQALNKYAAFPTSAIRTTPQHQHQQGQFVEGNQPRVMYGQPQTNLHYIQPQPPYQQQQQPFSPSPHSSHQQNQVASPPESTGSYLSNFSTGEGLADDSILNYATRIL